MICLAITVSQTIHCDCTHSHTANTHLVICPLSVQPHAHTLLMPGPRRRCRRRTRARTLKLWYWLHNVCAQYKSQHSQMNADEQWTKYVKPRLLHAHTHSTNTYFSPHHVTRLLIINASSSGVVAVLRGCGGGGVCLRGCVTIFSVPSGVRQNTTTVLHSITAKPAIHPNPVGVCARI